jgi:hypothetical protein
MSNKALLLIISILPFIEYTSIGQEIPYKELIYLSDKGLPRYEKAIAFRDIRKDFHYFIYEVVDNRTVKDRIGSYSQADKIVFYFKFPQPLDTEINNLLNLTELAKNEMNKDSVKIEIERFGYIKSMEKRSNNKGDKGNIIITLNFLSSKGKLLYQYNFEMKDKPCLFNQNGSIEIIQDAFLNAFYVFNYISKDYVPYRYTQNEITNYTELFSQNLQKGFYVTFHELNNNYPSIRPDFAISKEVDAKNYNKWEVVFKDSVLENSKNDFFDNVIGFCDGKDIYINAFNYASKFGFCPVIVKGRYLYLIGKSKPSSNIIDGVGIGYNDNSYYTSVSGPLGGGVASAFATIPSDRWGVIDLVSEKLFSSGAYESLVDEILSANTSLKEKYGNNPSLYTSYLGILIFKEINKLY